MICKLLASSLFSRCDNKVWKSGVDRAYNEFLATKPGPDLTAVLLSIL